VAYIELYQVGHAVDEGQILVIQPVACIYFQTQFVSLSRGSAKPVQFHPGLGVVPKCLRECARVQFDELGANTRGGVDLPGVRGNEETDFNSSLAQSAACFAETALLA